MGYEKKLNNIIIQYSNEDGLYKDHCFFNLNETQIKEFEQFIMKFKSKFHQSEDEKIRKEILALIEWSKSYSASGITTDEAKEMIAWLEKQGASAWSKEDKNVLEDIEEAIINYWHGDTQDIILEWLKSLKDRVHPQWKPSDEQMHYLYWIANIKLGDSVVEEEVSKHLNELYEDLKKLKG